MKKQTSTQSKKTKQKESIPVVRSKFYAYDRRTPVITGRVVGLNLQGYAHPKKAFFFSFSKEVKSTIFMLEFVIAGVRWTMTKSFEELRQFYTLLHTDEQLGKGRELLTAPFPSGDDGEDDVMLLVERRELIETFVKETLELLDPEIYAPLALFLDSPPHFDHVRRQLKKVIKVLRRAPNKKKLLLRLFEFYSKDLMDFVCKLENGIEVYNIDDRFASEEPLSTTTTATKTPSVLWLDVCEEPGLSRLCLAPKSVFALPAVDIYEDARLANGIFLSDIAEIRKGASSEAFRRQSFYYYHHVDRVVLPSSSLLPPLSSSSSPSSSSSSSSSAEWYDARRCVSVVGSERTLAFELVCNPAHMATDINTLRNAQSSGTRSSSNNNDDKNNIHINNVINHNGNNNNNINSNNVNNNVNNNHNTEPSDASVYRLHFMEMLNLLALQSLSAEDLFQRRRRFQKLRVAPSTAVAASPLQSPIFRSTHHLHDAALLQKDAVQTEALLVKGIEVEEEVVSPEYGVQIVSKMMRFDPVRRCLWITSMQHHEEAHRRRLEDEFDALHARPPGHEEEDDDEEEEEADGEGGRGDEEEDAEDKTESGGYEDDTEGPEDDDDIVIHSRETSSKMTKTNKKKEEEEDEKKKKTKTPKKKTMKTTTTTTSDVQEDTMQPQTSMHHAHGGLFVHHHQLQLASSVSRYLHIDDISEVRPGRISSFIDHPEEDACVLSIIGSATIIVLPVPSLAFRDKLVRRFQHFIFTHRRYEELMGTDTPAFFQPKHFPKRQQRLWKRQLEHELAAQHQQQQQQEEDKENEKAEAEKEEEDNGTWPASSDARASSHLLLIPRRRSHAPPPTRHSDSPIPTTPTSAVTGEEEGPSSLSSSLHPQQQQHISSSSRHSLHSHHPSHLHRAPRRHSHESHSLSLTSPIVSLSYSNAPGAVFVSPTTTTSTTTNSTINTTNTTTTMASSLPLAFHTPPPPSPLVGRSSSINGMYSHSRVARSVSNLRRSSSSTKGKNSLSEAFSLT